MTPTPLFEQMSLISTPDKFVISAHNAKAPGADTALVVHRGTGQMCVDPVSRHLPLPSTIKYKKKTIYGSKKRQIEANESPNT